jgi:hypothetical protein
VTTDRLRLTKIITISALVGAILGMRAWRTIVGSSSHERDAVRVSQAPSAAHSTPPQKRARPA